MEDFFAAKTKLFKQSKQMLTTADLTGRMSFLHLDPCWFPDYKPIELKIWDKYDKS